MTGAGTGFPTLTADPDAEDISDQVFVPVLGEDYLGDEPPPPPPPPLEKHVYDGGENDTGTCDICGKPKSDPIHIIVTPPPSTDDLIKRVTALEQKVSKGMIELEMRLSQLENAEPPSGGITEAQVKKILSETTLEVKVEPGGATFYAKAHSHNASGKLKP
jgi:hypothetical protein